MATATAATPEVQWIPIGRGARLLAVSIETMQALIESGRLSVREVPGAWPRVRLDEVLELAESCTRPATASR
jgi:hypothetical protein